MRIVTITTFLALVLGAAACGEKTASLEDIEKLKTEACACKEKACAESLDKKAHDMLTDATIKKHGEKGMGLAMDIIFCIESAKSGLAGEGAAPAPAPAPAGEGAAPAPAPAGEGAAPAPAPAPAPAGEGAAPPAGQ